MTNRLSQNCIVCSQSWSIVKIKRCTTEYENTIQMSRNDKRFTTRIGRELLQIKKGKTKVENIFNEIKTQFTEETTRANEYMKNIHSHY